MNKILVIDEDIQVRESVSLSLETAGYTVMGARTSREGLQSHGQFGASLIIMDVVALEDGEVEPIHWVSEQFPRIPMITLTGNIPASSEAMGVLQQFPCSVYSLQKPFTVDELLQAVQRVLSH